MASTTVPVILVYGAIAAIGFGYIESLNVTRPFLLEDASKYFTVLPLDTLAIASDD